ncbi:MAG: hypothetical protein BZY75_05830 [SAR202 cluster bacterium Io17-Chloro-G7]|nr:MAG: hypothetical protein BZY75_05830 [SAR202 cluster bacterium Io17-Chloro-G7]
MPAKVVDASVLGAIVFREPRAAEAVALLQDSDLYAPELMAYELSHIAQKKSILFPSQFNAFQLALEAAMSMDIRWRDARHPAVLRLALETGLTTYDACYLYLSRLLGAELATFDERLLRAT